MLCSAKLGRARQLMPTILDVVGDFLKDESAVAAIEYIALSAGIALAIITAVKPANLSPACRACGRRMRFARAISKFRRHPELRIYECDQCRETAVEEWRPRENAGRQMPNSREGARTVAAGLMVLRKKSGMSSLDIALIFGLWLGSIVFGWKQQPSWLVVPTVACIAYASFLSCRHSSGAAGRLRRGRQKIYQACMAGRAASLALFKLLGDGELAQKNQGEALRSDVALGTICGDKPLSFSSNQKIGLPTPQGLMSPLPR